MFNYNKFKDTSPENTINRINGLLADIGLQPHIEWVKSEFEGALSNRVSLPPTSMGTNGKGTDKSYALASGLAELIERIENGVLLIGHNSQKLQCASGFIFAPDETFIEAEELVEQDDPFVRFLFRHFGLCNCDDKVAFLKSVPRPSTNFLCVPFADPARNRIVYLPSDLYLPIYGSNGMAAGNTMEEALVQALSEILERYANKAVLEGVVPPEIPRDYWEETQISQLIRDIESSGRYRVSLRDCSLGKKIPATAIVISDLERGCFGVHFSCHPSLEVSIERLLTEAFQGKSLEEFTSYNVIGDTRMCYCIDNYPNLMKIGYGAYPIEFLSGEPNYEFTPCDEWNGLNNREMLEKLLEIIHNEGFEVLVRDTSHLGFPAYQVLVPGMSEMYFQGSKRFKELRTAHQVKISLSHFPDLTEEEENRLMLLMRFKEFSTLENTFAWLSTLPLVGNQLTVERVRACLHYKRGELEEASVWFKKAELIETEPEEKLFLLCCAEYARLSEFEADKQSIGRAILHYFPKRIAEDVHEKMQDPSLIMKKMFKPLGCENCDACPHAGINCEYPETEKIMFKIKAALAKSTVTQETVLNQLFSLMDSASSAVL